MVEHLQNLKLRKQNNPLQANAPFFITPVDLKSFLKEVPIIRNQSIDLLCKSMDWFLYDRSLRHERVHPKVFWCFQGK